MSTDCEWQHTTLLFSRSWDLILFVSKLLYCVKHRLHTAQRTVVLTQRTLLPYIIVQLCIACQKGRTHLTSSFTRHIGIIYRRDLKVTSRGCRDVQWQMSLQSVQRLWNSILQPHNRHGRNYMGSFRAKKTNGWQDESPTTNCVTPVYRLF